MFDWNHINLGYLLPSLGLAVVVMSSGCATIINSPTQDVEFFGLKSGMIMTTRYQKFKIHTTQLGTQRLCRNYGDLGEIICYDRYTGEDSVWLRLNRSIADIEVSLKCSSHSKAQRVHLKTSPDIWYFLVANMFLYPPIGWLIDYMTEEGWNIQSPVNLSQYCANI